MVDGDSTAVPEAAYSRGGLTPLSGLRTISMTGLHRFRMRAGFPGARVGHRRSVFSAVEASPSDTKPK